MSVDSGRQRLNRAGSRRNDHRCALPGYHHTVKHAITLLRWVAGTECDDPDTEEVLKQCRECARELKQAIRKCEESHRVVRRGKVGC